MDPKVRKMIDEILERRPDWREASEHDLRLRYASALADIAEHRRRILAGGNTAGVDSKLWKVLDGTGF